MVGDWQRLYRVHAGSQHGAVTVRQAVECGTPIRTFHSHVRMHGWQQLHRGVWAIPGSADSYARSAAAALLAASGSGLLTGVSVLHMMGALRRRPDRVDLLVPPALHLSALDGIRHFRGRWVAGDTPMQIEGMRAVPAVRALTDYAADHRQPEIERVIAELDRLRVAKPLDVAAYLDRRRLFPGRSRIQAALDAVSGELTHSAAERAGRRLLREGRLVLTPYPRPLLIEDRGTRVAEIDIPFPQVRYGVEVDGPHHQLPEVAAADKRRDRRLAQLGWVIDRFGVDEIEQSPQAFVRQVSAGLQAAMSRPVQPWHV